jgi:hypothetical protein
MKTKFFAYLIIPMELDVPEDCITETEKLGYAYELSWEEPLVKAIQDTDYEIEDLMLKFI